MDCQYLGTQAHVSVYGRYNYAPGNRRQGGAEYLGPWNAECGAQGPFHGPRLTCGETITRKRGAYPSLDTRGAYIRQWPMHPSKGRGQRRADNLPNDDAFLPTRDKTLLLRLESSTRDHWRLAAGLDGVSVSEMIRAVVNHYIIEVIRDAESEGRIGYDRDYRRVLTGAGQESDASKRRRRAVPINTAAEIAEALRG